MFNVGHLGSMLRSARALHLSVPDTFRWLWSYYGNRMPSFIRSSPDSSVKIQLRDGTGKTHPVEIRNNGFDWANVTELFLEDIYRVDMNNVTRVMDLGGNIGLASLLFALRFPGADICTVEPIPNNLDILSRNLASNSVKGNMLNCAAGKADGHVRFNISNDPRQHSSCMDVDASGDTVDVNVRSIPSLMALMGWAEIDVLKIDIEGGEKEILGGNPEWLNNVRCIIGEGHFGVGYTLDACRKDLEPMGFEVTEIATTEGAVLFQAHRPEPAAVS
jgi:FkbM family methyltransferase